MAGRWEGRVAHWSVESRSLLDDTGREGVLRRAERRMMSSTSSLGRVFVWGGLESRFEAEALEGGERSRLVTVVRRRWDFDARVRAILRA